MLESRLGYALYMLLPNELAWRMLSQKDRAGILAGDLRHNSERPDYADPECYGGGQGFDLAEDRLGHERGRRLQEFLERRRPERVLEIGPGSGFFTRQIVEFPSVRHYTAVDINGAFLEYLRPRLEAIACSRPGFTCTLVEGGTGDVQGSDFAAAVLLSTVHHVPDRRALLRDLAVRLNHGGAVFSIEPTHSLLRVLAVLRKIVQPGYLARQVATFRAGQASTHHRCTLGGFKRDGGAAGLRVVRAAHWDRPRRLQALVDAGVPLGPLARWFAQEMAVEMAVEMAAH